MEIDRNRLPAVRQAQALAARSVGRAERGMVSAFPQETRRSPAQDPSSGAQGVRQWCKHTF